MAAPVLHHHHGAVLEIPDALVGLLALLDDGDGHHLARRDDGLHRVGEVVEIEDADSLDLGQPVEVVVLRHDRGAACAGQLDETRVHLWRAGKVEVHQLADDVVSLLQGLDDGKAATALGPAHAVRRVRHALQLFEHEPRKQQPPGDEPGGRHVDDAAVDQHAGVHNDRLPVEGRRAVIEAGLRASAEQSDECFASAAAGAHADVDEHHRQSQRDEHAESPGQRVEEHLGQGGNQQRQNQPQRGSHDLAGGRLVECSLEPEEGFDRQQRCGQGERRSSSQAGGDQGHQGDRAILVEQALRVGDDESAVEDAEHCSGDRADDPRKPTCPTNLGGIATGHRAD